MFSVRIICSRHSTAPVLSNDDSTQYECVKLWVRVWAALQVSEKQNCCLGLGPGLGFEDISSRT